MEKYGASFPPLAWVFALSKWYSTHASLVRDTTSTGNDVLATRCLHWQQQCGFVNSASSLVLVDIRINSVLYSGPNATVFLLSAVLAWFAAMSMESSAKESCPNPKQLCHTLGQPYSFIWIELVFRDRHHYCIRWIHEILSTLHSVHGMFAQKTIVSIQ